MGYDTGHYLELGCVFTSMNIVDNLSACLKRKHVCVVSKLQSSLQWVDLGGSFIVLKTSKIPFQKRTIKMGVV